MKKYKKVIFSIVAIIILIPIIVGITQHNKELPMDISMDGQTYYTNDVKFLYDLTYQKDAERIIEQQLMEEALQIIDEANDFLVVDMFLYNDDYDRSKGSYPESAEQMTQALIAKRISNPNMPITVISDAVNVLYGSNNLSYFDDLKMHDIQVIITDLKPLRDSNPIYSSIWRTYLQWWQPSQNGFLPNPFNPDGGKGSFGSYFDLLNFKANHRKVVMNEANALLTSANLTHDGSSNHSNIGFIVSGGILADIYASEQAVAQLSGGSLAEVNFKNSNDSGELELKLLTEGKIKEAILQTLASTTEQSTIKMGVFYISDRDIVKAIKEAAERGATVQMILDPNKDAFGLEKNGIPNRQVAAELMKEENIEVRWYATNGEQYHSKYLFVENTNESIVIGGSANFTRRNLADYNLENNILVKMPVSHDLANDINAYFQRIWTNDYGTYTVEFKQYEDQSLWKKAMYRFQEFTGLSTF